MTSDKQVMFSRGLQNAVERVRRAMVRLSELFRRACRQLRIVRIKESGFRRLIHILKALNSNDPGVVRQTLDTMFEESLKRLEKLRLKGATTERANRRRALKNLQAILDGFYPSERKKWNPLNLLALGSMAYGDPSRFSRLLGEFHETVRENLIAVTEEDLRNFFAGEDGEAYGRFLNFTLLVGPLLQASDHDIDLPRRICETVSELAVNELFSTGNTIKIWALIDSIYFCLPDESRTAFCFKLLTAVAGLFSGDRQEFGLGQLSAPRSATALALLIKNLLEEIEESTIPENNRESLRQIYLQLSPLLEIQGFDKVIEIFKRLQERLTGDDKAL